MKNEWGVLNNVVDVQVAEKNGESVPVIIIGHRDDRGNGSHARLPLTWDKLAELELKIDRLQWDKKIEDHMEESREG